jgi:hypothetical protein
MEGPNFLPTTAYQVIPLTDMEREVPIKRWNEKQRRFVDATRVVKGGYLVYTAKGDSFFVETAERLEQLNLTEVAPIIDMNSGIIIPQHLANTIAMQAAGSNAGQHDLQANARRRDRSRKSVDDLIGATT